MTSLASSPQSDALEQSLLAQGELPEPAQRALRRVRELERELMLLRGALPDLSAQAEAEPESAWENRVANLLSRVVLFRMALAEPPLPENTVPGSGQDDAPATAHRAPRG
ncbi:MAG: hypothetical protein Q7R66_06420 [Undibacterium sp.]|uniref:hypothetical protein n=1 Tax=Undibacterium sp. TaxID=1914977 RepID=UPI002715A222|nr:hypothetical protein [Undibacterium sp.]MDO8651805.1 hypothetical protein [Undibacterium sp.]